MLLKEDLLCILKSGKDIALLDFKDWLFSDDVFGKNVQADHLRKWVRYAAVDYGDADIVIKSGKVFEELGWNKLKWNELEWSKTWIDCIYSFKTYFSIFLKFYLDVKMFKYGYILDHYDEIFAQTKKESVAKEKNIDVQLLNDLFEELNRFARNTHTIGNYMPCPDGEYNSIKGYRGNKYTRDRLDLLYAELCNLKNSKYERLKEKGETYKKCLEDKKEVLYLDKLLETDLLEYRLHNMKNEEDLEYFLKYLKGINPLIEERGLKIEEKLKIGICKDK